MCFFQFEALRYTAMSVIIVFAACNFLDDSFTVMTLCEGHEKIKTGLIVSLVMNTVAYIPIVTGFYGTYRNHILKLQQFIITMMAYFFGKIVLSKFLVLFELPKVELIVSYQLCIITSGLCFVFAIPLTVKLLEKENEPEPEIQV
ncbi:PREDICTED: uncharacterized protein LOC108614414 [Drosophila arizonae]|uniref:Uncharacterized protein LOC108614414 n=1 Tax=Drosophila arizonae TaxID=7263 RepID=A0ABM1P9Y3_DROAR|nr:PREDICTED: uncharacterized protein LOC108614414 [Drosophila arizonae]